MYLLRGAHGRSCRGPAVRSRHRGCGTYEVESLAMAGLFGKGNLEVIPIMVK